MPSINTEQTKTLTKHKLRHKLKVFVYGVQSYWKMCFQLWHRNNYLSKNDIHINNIEVDE